MTDQINVCLINAIDNPTNRKSAIILNGKFILAPAAIVFPSIIGASDIEKRLSNFEVVNLATDGPHYHTILQKRYVIVSKNSGTKQLSKSLATVRHIFNCRRINVVFDDILTGMQPIGENRLSISSFVVLQIEGQPIGIQPFESTHICREHVQKLNSVYSVTIPFANECFFDTINVGKIANVFGENGCVMVASMPLVTGCEGGAVFNRQQ